MTAQKFEIASDVSSEIPSGKNKNTENFPVGSFLVRADLRPHIHAFYQFARDADDVADSAVLSVDEKIARLNRFAACVQGQADDVPSAAHMHKSLQAKNISSQHSLDLLKAFTQDVTKLRYNNWQELLDYCRYSASPVGRHVLALHGIGQTAWPANDALCTALQIINHLQDCGDDAQTINRIYIPLDNMQAKGATPEMLLAKQSSPQLRAVLNDMLDKTDPLIALGMDLPNHIPDFRLKMETAVIGSLAFDIAALLRTRDPLSQNCKLSKPAIVWAVCKGMGRAFLQ